MNGASLATAFAAGRKSDELRTRYLITPLALGGTPKGTQEPRLSAIQQPKNKTQPQPKQAGKRPPQQVVPNAKSTKRQKQTSTKHAGGSEANNRYARVKKNAPSQLHMSNNGKSICFAFQTPKGCRRGETCYHQHVCAHCFGPHSFEECPNFSESRAAYLKQRVGSIRLARVSRKSVVKFQIQVVPASHPVDDVLPTVSSASAVVNPVSEKEGSVGIPTLPAVLPACALGSVENSASEKEGRVGFSRTARSFVLCATCLRVRSAEVAIFQFRKKVTIQPHFRKFSRGAARTRALASSQLRSCGLAVRPRNKNPRDF